MTNAVIVVILYITHSYILKLFFLPLFDIFLGQKSLGDFIHTPITENRWNNLFVQVLLQMNFG